MLNKESEDVKKEILETFENVIDEYLKDHPTCSYKNIRNAILGKVISKTGIHIELDLGTFKGDGLEENGTYIKHWKQKSIEEKISDSI